MLYTCTLTTSGDGNRLSQSVTGGETYTYVYDINRGLPELIVETTDEAACLYIYAGRVISQVGAAGEAYYHQDGLGPYYR